MTYLYLELLYFLDFNNLLVLLLLYSFFNFFFSVAGCLDITFIYYFAGFSCPNGISSCCICERICVLLLIILS